MPNHITNYIEIKGTPEQITALFEQAIKIIDGEQYFDFNAVIPQPADLMAIVSPVQVVETQAEADKINSDYRPSHPKQNIRAITLAESTRLFREYGETDWYEWSVKYWGTKWNAYDFTLIAKDDTHIVCQFDTAWSPPIPIFEKLEQSGLTVNCRWQDEDDPKYGEYGDDAWDCFEKHIEYHYIGKAKTGAAA